jgi:DNA polymerase-1
VTEQTRPLLALDADALMHRAYHALPPVAGAGGRPVAALLGFTNMLLQLWDSERPRAVAAGIDTRKPGYRNALYPPYQRQRDAFDPPLVEQLDDLPAYLEAFGILAARIGTTEADDVIATLAVKEEARGGTCLVVTSDRDAYQLVSAAVTVLRPVKGVSVLERVDRAGVVERYGVLPEQVPDLIALRGDPSDNLPGARGIGQKTAAGLLQRHGDLEGVIAAAPGLAAGRRAGIEDAGADLRTFLAVATMQRDLDVEPPADGEPDWAGGAAAARERGMARLAERLEERAG